MADTQLREMKVDELRIVADKEGIDATSSMRKDDLIEAIEDARGTRQGADAGSRGDAGPDGGHVRTSGRTSDSLKYAQEVTSPDDEPERAGRSLATTSHEVIRQWAQERGGTPATVAGTEHGDHLGVLRFDFGDSSAELRQVSWDEWFATFDERQLNFLYQETRKDGRQSNFFRLESPRREDA
jgi:hypothetical protein